MKDKHTILFDKNKLSFSFYYLKSSTSYQCFHRELYLVGALCRPNSKLLHTSMMYKNKLQTNSNVPNFLRLK